VATDIIGLLIEMNSAVHGFHNLSDSDKVKAISDFCKLDSDEPNYLRKIIESSSVYSGFAHNFKINGKDRFVYIETEEASVVAGASYAAGLCYESGGIKSSVISSNAIGQLQVIDVKYPEESVKKLLENKARLIEMANRGHRFSKAHDLKIKNLRCDMGNFLDLQLIVDPGDSMGAAVSGDMIDSIRGEISVVTGAKTSRGMASNYCGRLVEAELKVPIDMLARKSNDTNDEWSGEEVNNGVLWLDRYAINDENRARTNNKGIMNGVIGAAQPLRQDTRAISAANCSYKPLSSWSSDGEYLFGKSKTLIPCGIKGGEVERDYRAGFLLNKIYKVNSANELAQIIASTGLASNLAALSMNSTKGLKEGHGMHRL
jgi:hydroxymethylglutaryl-CoA reductase